MPEAPDCTRPRGCRTPYGCSGVERCWWRDRENGVPPAPRKRLPAAPVHRPPPTEPRPGYWLLWQGAGKVLLPACIECAGDPSNLAAFILGAPVPLDRVWYAIREREITAVDYRLACANARWQRRYSPTEPLADPRRPVDWVNLPLVPERKG